MHKILIVDDEPNIVMSLDYLLRRKNYNVFVARNGSEALSAIEEHKPDLILLDIMMPDVDGYEICERVKADPETHQIKIIFISAKSKKSDIEKGYELGADMYMVKPFSNKDLLDQITKQLS
ncbi:MAG: response regulator [Bacteroidetes bacterium]|uniref:Response regulator n=1 Tax=Phaeocystidibacter marisrubri TaxID=1577780 RepID=A0A6L3ZJU1_9FLAO|nr:response regulator [Phaeocystidibacter marisrubri]KAB2817909.1 response regulator [Phaeocystidibacter marisrubri]TNE26927.1 MAG: response regulator [Bacteroidota bacterium]GGH72918.1 hypothetical protein GCM10011318_17390 [Phaeocystidibacter marisrubri]